MMDMLNAFREELEIREQHLSIFSGNEGGGNQSTPMKERTDLKPRPAGKTPSTASALFAKQDGGTVNTRSCAFCNEEHDERNCGNVTSKEERKKLIFKYGRCLICLKKGHRAFQCH